MTASTNGPQLDPCGCCEAGVPERVLFNRPGLSSLAYRIGTHQVFLRRMLARLSMEKIPTLPPGQDVRPLAALTTRASDDPSIALLDAWAIVADVLTFYQERIANEGFLRTATERRSVLELARTIGYELNPGVAAGTFLAFTVETAPGAPGVATVSTGTKVQSVPSQDQRPQTFETTETIQTRAEWNALRVQVTAPQDIARGITRLYLKGVTTQLQPGDGLLIVGDEREQDHESERWDFRILQTVTAYPNKNTPEKSYTLVAWSKPLGDPKPSPGGTDPAHDNVRVYAFRQRAALFGYNAPDWRAMPDSVKKGYKPDVDLNNPGTEWPDFEIKTVAEKVIDLDSSYPKVLADSWLILKKPGWVELYKAKRVSIDSRTNFTLTSKTTRVTLDTSQNLGLFPLRETLVFAQSESLDLAERPLIDPVHGDEVVLDRLVGGLSEGQTLMVSGRRIRVTVAQEASGLSLASPDGSQSVALQPGDQLTVVAPPVQVLLNGTTVMLEPDQLVDLVSTPSSSSVQIEWQLMDRDGFVGSVTAPSDKLILQPADKDDPTVHEVSFIKTINASRDRTTIILRNALQNSYDRTTVAINANVARATHGETVKDEVMGSGDGAQVHQQFTLKKPPLTYVSASTGSGARNTLILRVGGVLWDDVPSLFGLNPSSQDYIVRIDDSGKTTVTFGDGERGARLPTGQENVRVTYRSGIGVPGMVATDSLTLLQTRPFGIRGVTNPLAATGAADPESLEGARTNAPLTVLTLDRIVSLKDFEDFARAFAGIGKANAAALWTGEHVVVHITIAAANGGEVSSASDLYKNLVKAIDAHRDPGLRVEVTSFRRCTFSLEAAILVDPRAVTADVLAQVKQELLRAFSFEQRDFGQPVTSAEIITVIQATKGVVAVDLDQLTLDPPCGAGAAAGGSLPPAMLPARIARQVGETTDLLLLNPAGVTLKEMTP